MIASIQQIRKRIRTMQAYVALDCGAKMPRQASMGQQRLYAGERTASGIQL